MIDSHTHFDLELFDTDRLSLAQLAYTRGVTDLVLIGYLAQYFDRLELTANQLNRVNIASMTGQSVPHAHLAAGLHPFYIEQHQPDDMLRLEKFISKNTCIAIGEIGLDTYLPHLKQPELFGAQVQLFEQQLKLAQDVNLPVMLHIRKSHADVLQCLKRLKFKNGGIAHAFSGGIEEARAFIKLGFKLGITGQVTDPNAKKLRSVVQQIGSAHLVLETDCPDMTPLSCRGDHVPHEPFTRNTPANLPTILSGLAELLQVPIAQLDTILIQNTHAVLPRLVSFR